MPRQDQTKIISGKDLGQLALPSFCSRCFWLERHFGKAPSIFPGIFSTLDSLTKRSVSRSFSERAKHPDWFPIRDKNIREILKIPRISIPISEYGNWTLTGDPDNVFKMEDSSYYIVDYKTARFTGRQDELLPMYEVQLNAYAFALERQGKKPISRLSLIYCEPGEDLDSDNDFRLTFKTKLLDIEIKPEIIPELLLKARAILSRTIPSAHAGCRGICSWAEQIQNHFISPNNKD
jgi:hypothetical protein